MESEIPPFSYNEDDRESELSSLEAIAALLQVEIEALKQVERVGDQLFQVLERQMIEAETLITRIKQHRNVSPGMKKLYKGQYWWDRLLGEIKVYREWCESYRILLESANETCSEKLSAFKQLQEDVDTLYPQ